MGLDSASVLGLEQASALFYIFHLTSGRFFTILYVNQGRISDTNKKKR